MKKTPQTSYKIRQVVNLTGVSEFVLRAWENRYHAFDPMRTNTGRRMYSKNDVMKARLLFELTEQGHKISEIASFSLQELQKIAEKSALPILEPVEKIKNTLVEKLLLLAQQQDWDEVQIQFRNQREKKSARTFIHEIILPLLSELGMQVAFKKLSIAQEHIMSAMVKEHLYMLRKESFSQRNDLRLVLAGQEGDYHDLGLLIALVLASHSGIKTLFLGANVPKRDLCEACIKFKATHLLLSSMLSKKEGAKEEILNNVQFIDEHIPSQIVMWVVGRNAAHLSIGLKRTFQIINNFSEFEIQIKNKKQGTVLA